MEQVEGRQTPISQHELVTGFGLMVDINCRQLSAAMFHMLNQLFTGEAHKELSDHETAEGLEVWRTITINLTNKGPLKRSALLDKVNAPARAKTMAGVRGILKEWEKHLREYHSAGGLDFSTDELKIMLLRKMLPVDDKKRLTHREFVEGAMGTGGETYDAMRLRVVETIDRGELEGQAREGRILNAEDNTEQILKEEEDGDGAGEGGEMDDDELGNLFSAIDSGALNSEQVFALQRRIQRKGRCFNCGKQGHMARECRAPKRKPGQFTRGGTWNPAAGKECHNCKQQGHFARDCPQPPATNGGNGNNTKGASKGGARPFVVVL